MYDQKHADIFQDKEALEKISIQEIASEIAGRTIREIIITNPHLLNRIILILNKHLKEAETSQFVRNMSEEAGLPISEILKWLNKLLIGVEKM